MTARPASARGTTGARTATRHNSAVNHRTRGGTAGKRDRHRTHETRGEEAIEAAPCALRILPLSIPAVLLRASALLVAILPAALSLLSAPSAVLLRPAVPVLSVPLVAAH